MNDCQGVAGMPLAGFDTFLLYTPMGWVATSPNVLALKFSFVLLTILVN